MNLQPPTVPIFLPSIFLPTSIRIKKNLGRGSLPAYRRAASPSERRSNDTILPPQCIPSRLRVSVAEPFGEASEVYSGQDIQT